MQIWTGLQRAASQVLRPLLTGVLRVLRGLLTLALALILLFEEWGWRPLAELLALLAQFRLWARVEGWIAGLPPYAALTIFVLPSAVLLPIKLGALYLLAQGKVILATAFLALAKVASTALVARIFMLTKPALMQLSWFAKIYNWLMPWKEAVFIHVRASWIWRYGRMLKSAVKREVRRAWLRWRPLLIDAAAQWRSKFADLSLRARIAIAQTWRQLRRKLRA